MVSKKKFLFLALYSVFGIVLMGQALLMGMSKVSKSKSEDITRPEDIIFVYTTTIDKGLAMHKIIVNNPFKKDLQVDIDYQSLGPNLRHSKNVVKEGISQEIIITGRIESIVVRKI